MEEDEGGLVVTKVSGSRPAGPQLAAELVQLGMSKLNDLSVTAVSGFDTLMASAQEDLGRSETITRIVAEGQREDEAVEIISRMVSSANGLTKLAMVTQLLLRLSGLDEEKRSRSAQQLLSWMKAEKDRKFSDNLTRFESMVSVLGTAVERATRTPTENWNEITEIVTSGGGMKYLVNIFAGTPAEAVLEVVTKSLLNSQVLSQKAKVIERSRADVQKATVDLTKVVDARAKARMDNLNKFRKAKAAYETLQSNLDAMKTIDDNGRPVDPEMVKDLDKKARQLAAAFQEYQKYRVTVETDPVKLEEARTGVSHGLRLTDSLAMNQARLENLAIQFNQNALLYVFQMVLTLSVISSLYCDQTLAANRRAQLEIRTQCQKTLDLVSRGEFEKVLDGGNTGMVAVPAM